MTHHVISDSHELISGKHEWIKMSYDVSFKLPLFDGPALSSK